MMGSVGALARTFTVTIPADAGLEARALWSWAQCRLSRPAVHAGAEARLSADRVLGDGAINISAYLQNIGKTA